MVFKKKAAKKAVAAKKQTRLTDAQFLSKLHNETEHLKYYMQDVQEEIQDHQQSINELQATVEKRRNALVAKAIRSKKRLERALPKALDAEKANWEEEGYDDYDDYDDEEAFTYSQMVNFLAVLGVPLAVTPEEEVGF